MIRVATLLLGITTAAAASAQQAPAVPATAQSAPAAPAAAPAAQAPSLRDPADPRARNVAVRCRPGQVKGVAGNTLGEIFGAAWPASPDVPAARRTPAQALTLGRVAWPEGADAQANVTSAVLVDAQGRPLRVEVLCASAQGLDAAVKQAAMQGTYRAATFDGTPATSVVVVGWRKAPPRAGR